MGNSLKTILKMTIATGVMVAGSLAAQAEGLSGLKVVTTNTFTGKDTKGVETDVGMFGMANNKFSVVGDGVELPAFLTIYDIDFGADSISYNWVESPFSKKISGPTPKGNFDRNYFIFDLPAGKAITKVEFDAAGSKLLKGSKLPTASVIAGNRIVTVFGEGVIRKAGFKPKFKVTIGKAK